MCWEPGKCTMPDMTLRECLSHDCGARGLSAPTLPNPLHEVWPPVPYAELHLIATSLLLDGFADQPVQALGKAIWPPKRVLVPGAGIHHVGMQDPAPVTVLQYLEAHRASGWDLYGVDEELA